MEEKARARGGEGQNVQKERLYPLEYVGTGAVHHNPIVTSAY